MGETFYAQSAAPPATLTVRQLIERLQSFDPDAPVIFQSPLYGCFGSNTAYSMDDVSQVSMPEEKAEYPACTSVDEETGDSLEVEAWTEVRHAWSGVVIS